MHHLITRWRKVVITIAAALALVGAGAAVGLAAPNSTAGNPVKACVVGTNRVIEHAYTRTAPPACSSGFRVTLQQQASTITPPAPPTLTTKTLTLPSGPVNTGGSFSANKTFVDSMNLSAGTYQVTVNFKAVAVSGNGVAPQMFVYNGAALSDFSNDLFNVGSGDLQASTTNHDGYYSGSGVIVVPSGGETLDFYAFGYDEDTGSGSYTLESATVAALAVTQVGS